MQTYFFLVRVIGTYVVLAAGPELINLYRFKRKVKKSIDNDIPKIFGDEVKSSYLDSIKCKQRFLTTNLLLGILLIVTAFAGQYK